MLARRPWLASFFGLAAFLLQPRADATEYTLDPSRTVVSFAMRSMGTHVGRQVGNAIVRGVLGSILKR